MGRKRPGSAPKRASKPAAPAAEQLVLPFALQVGDIVLEDGAPGSRSSAGPPAQSAAR